MSDDLAQFKGVGCFHYHDLLFFLIIALDNEKIKIEDFSFDPVYNTMNV